MKLLDDRDPPAAKVESPGAPPFVGAVWIGGYWQWRDGRHVWVSGHWENERPGYVTGHWRRVRTNAD